MGSGSGAGRAGVVAVWAIAAVGAGIVVGLAAAGRHVWFGNAQWLAPFGALALVFGVAVLAALVIQLATRRPAGYVARASASVAGAAAVIVLAAVLLVPFVLQSHG